MFIQRLRSLHYEINDEMADIYGINSDIDAFCLKYGIEHKRMSLQLFFEELLFNVLKGHRPVTVDITYSEIDYSLELSVLAKGMNSTILGQADPVAASILNGMSRSISESIIPEGLLIKVK